MSITAMKQALMDMTKIPTLSHGVLVRLKDVEIALLQAIAEAEKQEHEFVRGECVKCGASIEKQEPVEYWNAVEGWVKLDEVREHFDSVNCGTIYKNDGEGRVPLYTHPPKREWVGLTDEDDLDWEEGGNLKDLVKAIEAKLKEKNT